MSSNMKKYFVITLSILLILGTRISVFAQPEHDSRGGWGKGQKQSDNRGPSTISQPTQHEGSGGAGQNQWSSNNRGSSILTQSGQHKGTGNPGPGQWKSGNRGPSAQQGTVQGTSRGPAPRQGTFTDSRYHHDRSYPARGQAFRTLPRDHKVIMHDHSRYYSANGIWYRHDHGRYIVVAPPVGLFIPFLPLFYTTIWFGGMPYYYANETYYIQRDGGYEVVEPPQDELSEIPPVEDQTPEDRLFIYPRKGQSEEQQAKDRYECHKWAAQQTNYDPTQIPSSIPASQVPQARMDYNRAMTACLDARGYTAK